MNQFKEDTNKRRLDIGAGWSGRDICQHHQTQHHWTPGPQGREGRPVPPHHRTREGLNERELKDQSPRQGNQLPVESLQMGDSEYLLSTSVLGILDHTFLLGYHGREFAHRQR